MGWFWWTVWIGAAIVAGLCDWAAMRKARHARRKYVPVVLLLVGFGLLSGCITAQDLREAWPMPGEPEWERKYPNGYPYGQPGGGPPAWAGTSTQMLPNGRMQICTVVPSNPPTSFCTAPGGRLPGYYNSPQEDWRR